MDVYQYGCWRRRCNPFNFYNADISFNRLIVR